MVRIDSVLVVKRVQPLGKGKVRLVSTNPAFQPMELDLSEFGEHEAGMPFDFLGRVVWAGRRY